jgi:hypothetical protein
MLVYRQVFFFFFFFVKFLVSGEPDSVSISFHFADNPFFTNKVFLYIIIFSLTYQELKLVIHVELTESGEKGKTDGCIINWKEGQEIGVFHVKNKV